MVNADCRSWDIPNLFICDGSVFPTAGGRESVADDHRPRDAHRRTDRAGGHKRGTQPLIKRKRGAS